MRVVVLAAVVSLAGCIPEEGPMMRPGDDCLSCHGGSGGGEGGEGGGEGDEDARPWSFAGTVYATPNASRTSGIPGAIVRVTDARGVTFGVRSNLAGNFYSAESLTFPLRVCVERNGGSRCMEKTASDGACNHCHTWPNPQEDAQGRITAP